MTNMKFVPHQMTLKIISWWYCARCGLVALNNEATRRAIKAGCEREGK